MIRRALAALNCRSISGGRLGSELKCGHLEMVPESRTLFFFPDRITRLDYKRPPIFKRQTCVFTPEAANEARDKFVALALPQVGVGEDTTCATSNIRPLLPLVFGEVDTESSLLMDVSCCFR